MAYRNYNSNSDYSVKVYNVRTHKMSHSEGTNSWSGAKSTVREQISYYEDLGYTAHKVTGSRTEMHRGRSVITIYAAPTKRW